jgi:hypothetical protein
MKTLKFIGQGTFEQHIESRVVPVKAGTVVDKVPDDIATDLLRRRQNGKPMWESVTEPQSSAKDTPKADAPAKPSK